MVTLLSEIHIGTLKNGVFTKRLSFDYVHECEISSSWEDITSKATIVLPKKVSVRYNNGEVTRTVPATFTGKNAIIKRNDAVRIYAGYRYYDKDGEKESKPLRFEGFVTRVDPSIPITIHCEDVMFKLKNITIKKVTLPEGTTLSEIMKAIMPAGYPWKTENITLGKFQVENSSVVETLDYLRREFGLSVFYQDGKIYVGFKYQSDKIEENIVSDKIPVFHFQHNIIDGKGLEYQIKDEILYKVRCINIKGRNLRHEITVGDADGEERTFHFYGAKDEDLKKLGNEALNKMKFTGFRGSFTTFLEPMVKHGYGIELRDDVIEDRNGTYIVKEVTTRFGVEGGRQVITLDRQIQ